MRPVIIRLAEITLLCGLLSSVSCALYYYQFIANTDIAFCMLLAIAFSAFVIANVFMLRRCFREMPKLKSYYFFNYVAYGIFIAISVIMYKKFGEVPYAWCFSTLKLAAFLPVDLSTLRATMLSHLVMLLVIAIAPLDINSRVKKRREAYLQEQQRDESYSIGL